MLGIVQDKNLTKETFNSYVIEAFNKKFARGEILKVEAVNGKGQIFNVVGKPARYEEDGTIIMDSDKLVMVMPHLEEQQSSTVPFYTKVTTPILNQMVNRVYILNVYDKLGNLVFKNPNGKAIVKSLLKIKTEKQKNEYIEQSL